MGSRAIADFSLTKSAFLEYLHCPGFAWLKMYQPELVPPADDPAAQRRIDFGNQIDRLTRARFAGGTLIEPLNLNEAVLTTSRLLDCPKVTILFQPAIRAEQGFVARADILVRDGEGWRLIEVKSAKEVKSEHVVDAAFQVATFEAAGLRITSVSVLHLDGAYRRNGQIDPVSLFTERDVSAEVRAQLSAVRADMDRAYGTLSCADKAPPCACHLKSDVQHCSTFRHFHPEFPERGSIHELQRITAGKISAAVDRGVFVLDDWPPDIALTANQQRQLDVHRAGRALVNRDEIRGFLAQLAYPLYFLDYETSSVPLPMYDGCWPYQQLPFQYSLHIVERDGEPIHREFLATDVDHNPSHRLASQLACEIGPLGSVLSWNASFEKGRNRDMAGSVPDFAPFFESLNARMVDLMEVVRKGYLVDPGFRGSASIKVVLPVVAPDISYKSLAIGDGTTASDRWLGCALGEIRGADRAATFAALREYCALDTLAMVRIWQFLTRICAAESESSEDAAW